MSLSVANVSLHFALWTDDEQQIKKKSRLFKTYKRWNTTHELVANNVFWRETKFGLVVIDPHRHEYNCTKVIFELSCALNNRYNFIAIVCVCVVRATTTESECEYARDRFSFNGVRFSSCKYSTKQVFYIYFNVRNIYKHAHKSVSHTNDVFFCNVSINSALSDK